MKRTKLNYDNSIDGNQLKKIKKLTFQLADDEIEEKTNSNEVVRNSSQITDIHSSDDESDVSECDSEYLFDQDSEKLDEKDSKALETFLNPDIAKDIIEGMNHAKEEVALNMVDEIEEMDWNNIEGIDEQLEIHKNLMIHYKKGRIFPKLVKVLPQIPDWIYIMEKLDFPSWTPTAVQLMTDQFKAKGGDGVALYYKNFLLPCVRDCLAQNKRLDNTLYRTLQDAMFRRREFMTSILLPWCDDNITGKEAEVLGSVLKYSTVKVDVAAPAMTVIMTQMPFSKETLMVLRFLLEKKYNLPYQTINAFVDYFYRAAKEDYSQFYTDNGKMPVLWHQTLHLFTSLYYPNLNGNSASKLFHLCRVQFHDKITETIRAFLKLIPRTNDEVMAEGDS